MDALVVDVGYEVGDDTETWLQVLQASPTAGAAPEPVGSVADRGGNPYGHTQVWSCDGLAGRAQLCLASLHATPSGDDHGGGIWLLDVPLAGPVEADSAPTVLTGDPGDQVYSAAAVPDLDGDGLADLVTGGYYAAGGYYGRVAMVSDPPTGSHRVWDLAFATIDGEAYGELGIRPAAGDVDGDGHTDLYLPYAFSPSTQGFVFAGPFSGAIGSSAARARFDFSDDLRGFLPGALGDLDGDGTDDVAIGTRVTGGGPDRVYVWLGAPCGPHTEADASLVLTSGATTVDDFGAALVSGDFDGDGVDDLAVGAPADGREAPGAGSVTLFYAPGL